jgi:pimeloyl-ACP methyl ester carboxylesterase
MDAVSINGLDVSFERVGAGPDVVLLHGYVGDGPATWRPQLDALADQFRLVAWDAPGAGRSSDPPESFGITGYADCLARFIEVLELDRPHLVGLSFGGALALAFGHRHPTAARSLVVVSGYAGWRGSLPPAVAEDRLQQAIRLSELSGERLAATLLPTMFDTSPPSGVLAEFGDSLRSFHPGGFRAMAEASAEDLRGALADITLPTLLVYGDRDVRAPVYVADQLHAALPDSTLVVLEAVGHVCNLEASDAFNETLRSWLTAHA